MDNNDQFDESQCNISWAISEQRTEPNELLRQIDFVSSSPIVSGILKSVSGLMAILNEDRQILAINGDFLRAMGIEDPSVVIGFRPGEALQCAYVPDNSFGCGTGKFCPTCGAAIAITTALATDTPTARKCALKATRGNTNLDLCFHVKATSVDVGSYRFILVFIQDITASELQSSFERAFLHDIKNSIMGLGCTVELMSAAGNNDPSLLTSISRISSNLVRDIKILNSIVYKSLDEITVIKEILTVGDILNDVKLVISNRKEATNKKLALISAAFNTQLHGDRSLISKVLINMLINAFEASSTSDEVKLSVTAENSSVNFIVWNSETIPPEVSLRIFQLHFSTKQGAGRGIGTYSMKVIGEDLLGGKVSFKSNKGEGTSFIFSLPELIHHTEV